MKSIAPCADVCRSDQEHELPSDSTCWCAILMWFFFFGRGGGPGRRASQKSPFGLCGSDAGLAALGVCPKAGICRDSGARKQELRLCKLQFFESGASLWSLGCNRQKRNKISKVVKCF